MVKPRVSLIGFPEPKPVTRQQLLLVRDIDRNLNGVGMRGRRSHWRTSRCEQERPPVHARYRNRAPGPSESWLPELFQIQCFSHARGG
jgi:hypothetical protein